MLKNDRWITEQAAQGMLEPFQKGLVRHRDPDLRAQPVLSFGCSSYGYDLRLSAQEFMIFRHVPGTVMNPKRFNPANLEPHRCMRTRTVVISSSRPIPMALVLRWRKCVFHPTSR